MIIQTADFVISSSKFDKLPSPTMPEYAFIGRSNVGKSSLINMLCNRKGLAKTSGKPGKTITINHFIINNSWYLVDLPGYGYARRSKEAREIWLKLMEQYLHNRQNLISTFILVDSRIEAQASDLQMMEWMAIMELPFVIVFTKTDKLGHTKLEQLIAAYKKKLLQQWEELPEIILSSSETGRGRDEILNFIEANNELTTLAR